MKVRSFIRIISGIMLLALTACGSGGGGGGEGLNGSLSLDATATGKTVTATATYSHPTESNKIGVPITFISGGQTVTTQNTNGSGTVQIAYNLAAFNNTQNVIVQARTGSLEAYKVLSVTGRTLTMTAPGDVTQTTTQAAGTTVTIPLTTSSFVTYSDPFDPTSVAGRTINISASASLTDTTDTLTSPSTTTTVSSGTAPLAGAQIVMHVQALNVANIAVITWTATDALTGLTASGITKVTLTKTS
ncbi:MAG: hypothetical protein HYS23_07430 [Geobacter sp.]|nr:hypothetical protein [Geobacter sp.]